MMGTLTAPTRASTAPALSLLRGSSMAACKAMKPMYRNSRITTEVSRASHTHQVPQVGRPHSDPVHKVSTANRAPVGASARAIMNDSRVPSTRPTADQKAMAR